MALLITGLVLFCLVHLSPAVSTGLRDGLKQKLGENPYRGLFSLVILGSLVLIVFGWKSAVPQTVYDAPLAANPFTSLMILAGLVLFFASQAKGNIKRFIRHPQMVGTILWGVAHLLTNGDSRSVLLFGGLTLWAVLEIVACNRRDGQWERPGPAPIKNDIIPAVVGLVVFVGVAHFHAALFGVPAMPG